MNDAADQEAGRPPEFLPTPEEIGLACEKIRAGWSEQETISRQSYRLPKVRANGVLSAAKQARDAADFRARERQRHTAKVV